jgi:FkbM family methyltransferase
VQGVLQGADPNGGLVAVQRGTCRRTKAIVAGIHRVALKHGGASAGPHAFLDTAAVMANLDLVVTSDTSVAHLAGALGRPTWMGVKAIPEWRWLLEGDDSPWYPTMRLFRQEAPGDWAGVFDRMATELAAVVGGAGERMAPVDRRWAVAPQPAVVEAPFRHGRIRFYRADTIIGRSLAEYGEWSEEEVAICLACLRPGDTVVEAGANVGAHTVPLARHLGSSGRIHSFEPQAGLMDVLRQNVAINGLSNVVLHHAAVGSEQGAIVVPAVDYGRPGNFGGLAIGAGTGTEVPLVTVDSLGLEQVRLLKADVEGMEGAILEGARETIARCRPVLYLENDRPETAEVLIRMLLTDGYRVWWHTPPLFNPGNVNRNTLNIFPRVVSKNILCIPAEQDAIVIGLPEVRFAEG